MKQIEGETILQFVTRLKIGANDCAFGNNTDDFVRNQMKMSPKITSCKIFE